eukprot:Skav231563  [mRNA]  locus=scaffold481:141371:148293:- [translate_table: standard]
MTVMTPDEEMDFHLRLLDEEIFIPEDADAKEDPPTKAYGSCKEDDKSQLQHFNYDICVQTVGNPIRSVGTKRALRQKYAYHIVTPVLKEIIKASWIWHNNDIAVFMDFVGAHFAKDEWGLVEYSGVPQYEYEGSQGEIPGWGTARYNYAKAEVQAYLLGAAHHWIDQFHIDGMRVDAVAAMIYKNFGKEEDGDEIMAGKATPESRIEGYFNTHTHTRNIYMYIIYK